MGHLIALEELLFVASVAVLVALILARLKVPIIAVLIVAGALVGPFGFGLVRDPASIEELAEVGVVLLLFTIGLEFSFARLARIAKLVAVGGSLQVGLTIAAAVLVVWATGHFSLSRGLFFGFLVALSSTAIVLRALSERAESNAPHGRFIIGVLVFQDICVVPMMLLLPVLGGRGGDSPVTEASLAMGKAAVVVTLTIVLARFLVPRFFALVDRARSREVFILSVLVVCIGTAWLTSLAGLSLALGAFLAGLVLADTDYGHRAMADVLPLRDVLASLFFISLGMLLDVGVIGEAPLPVFGLFAAILLGKALIATIAALAMRFPPRVAVMAGIGLAQFGEFGFVLMRQGAEEGLIAPEEMRVLLASAILTMVITPIMVRLAPHVGAGAARLRGLTRLLGVRDVGETAEVEAAMTDHFILVGYGHGGRAIASALKRVGLRYIIVEINAETVRAARAEGEPAFYGDIASEEAISHLGIDKARALLLLINDPDAAERAIVAARRQAPSTPILVRTHFADSAARLTALGAADIVVEEVEASIVLLARTLRRAGIPDDVGLATVEETRAALTKSRVR